MAAKFEDLSLIFEEEKKPVSFIIAIHRIINNINNVYQFERLFTFCFII